MKKHFSEKKLTAFVDDELSESESILIQEHLKTCEKCAGYIDQMQSVFCSLDKLATVPENPVLIHDTLNSWRFLKESDEFPIGSLVVSELRRIHRFLTVGAVAAGLAIGFLFGDIAQQGLTNEYSEGQGTTVVLQENDQTINDTYVSLIINNGREDL